jgi:hypothetical protein
MKLVKKAIDVLLALLSAYMLYHSLIIVSLTSGVVQGTEFSMLITLVNMFGLVTAWLALYAGRIMLGDFRQSGRDPDQPT